MEFEEAVRSRRMVRDFDETPVAIEVVDRLIDLARRSPSAGYSQGVDFIVLQGAEETARFWEVPAVREYWESVFPGVVRASGARPSDRRSRRVPSPLLRAGQGTRRAPSSKRVARAVLAHRHRDGDDGVAPGRRSTRDSEPSSSGSSEARTSKCSNDWACLRATSCSAWWRSGTRPTTARLAPRRPGRADLSEIIHRGGW